MEKDIAGKFKALGDPTRLRIYRFLCDCSCPVAVDNTGEVRTVVGPTVGDVCCHVFGDDRTSSNISFHLKELRTAGLITMEKRGKNVICGIDSAAQETMRAYFADMRKDPPDCC